MTTTNENLKRQIEDLEAQNRDLKKRIIQLQSKIQCCAPKFGRCPIHNAVIRMELRETEKKDNGRPKTQLISFSEIREIEKAKIPKLEYPKPQIKKEVKYENQPEISEKEPEPQPEAEAEPEPQPEAEPQQPEPQPEPEAEAEPQQPEISEKETTNSAPEPEEENIADEIGLEIDEALSQMTELSEEAPKKTTKEKKPKKERPKKEKPKKEQPTENEEVDISRATQAELMKLTLPKLKDLCKLNKVKGYSKMKTKETLVAFILENRTIE